MTSDHAKQLVEDGYERVATFRVGVPHFVWRVDVDVEFDRNLRLVEETVLRLIAAGVGEPDRVAALMGLDDGHIVPKTIVDLLSTGAIAQRAGRLALSSLGIGILQRAAVRDSRTYADREIRHDPYRDELRWSLEERELKEHDLREAGLRPLPAPAVLSHAAMEGRYREVHKVLEREGFPFDKEHEPESRQREVIRIRPLKWFVAYREAQLEAWYRKDRDEWDWLLLRGGGEETEVSTTLRELESEGAVIIPLEERREVPASEVADEVHAAVEEVQQAAKPALLETEAHREALRDAILEARVELIIVSPWLRTAAVDGEFLGWLRSTLAQNKGLKVTIGYGIDKAPGKQRDPGIRDQEEALRRLRDLERTARGRLRIVDVGNTHEKVVICDDRFVIITSFNFLSFNPRPGKGIRREMGFRVTDPAVVAQARKRLAKALGIATSG
jgi:hypothetical protein